MRELFRFLYDHAAEIIALLSVIPTSGVLKLLKEKQSRHYTHALYSVITIYIIVIAIFIYAMFYVRFPNIENESFYVAKQKISAMSLDYELEIPTEFSKYDEKDFYVKAVNDDEKSFIRTGSKVKLIVCGVTTDIVQYNALFRQNDDFYIQMIKLTNLIEALQNEINSGSGTGQQHNENNNAYINEQDIYIEFTSLVVDDSFYMEYHSDNFPGETLVIDNGPGIHGTFKYSRELTEYERLKWGHTGKLYDDSGELVGEPGNYPTFWSLSDGYFAMGFPKGFKHVKYVYELDNVIGDQWVTATIEFVY